ncbi:MAG TPA: tyrosinase family protein, partial [Longimicrobium sp.]|nr:tyrosinase family protein [Longimicrobium sp.]
MVYRTEAGVPEDAAVVNLATAMRALQARLDNKSFNYIAGLHGAPGWYCWHHQASRRTSVQARLFLPWHRAYLWWLEQALRDQVDDAALVWWDWTITRRIPTSFSA